MNGYGVSLLILQGIVTLFSPFMEDEVDRKFLNLIVNTLVFWLMYMAVN